MYAFGVCIHGRMNGFEACVLNAEPFPMNMYMLPVQMARKSSTWIHTLINRCCYEATICCANCTVLGWLPDDSWITKFKKTSVLLQIIMLIDVN